VRHHRRRVRAARRGDPWLDAVPAETIRIEVAYAEPDRAIVKTFTLATPATIAAVLRLAAAAPEFRGIDILNAPVGVFGKLKSGEAELAQGDRVEIYRSLAADPKSARRQRAKDQRR
jgi:uncharacterized protein